MAHGQLTPSDIGLVRMFLQTLRTAFIIVSYLLLGGKPQAKAICRNVKLEAELLTSLHAGVQLFLQI